MRPYRAREITDGLDGTAIRGGVVKFGTGYNTISDSEDKVMRAALDAHKETNAPLHAHTELGTLILEQIAIVKVEGVDPQRLTIAHVDRNPDPWVHRKATETGVFLCFNGISWVKYHPESVLIDCILKLVVRGHERQILIGGDIARRTMYRNYGQGGLGLGYILQDWFPEFIEEAGGRASTARTHSHISGRKPETRIRVPKLRRNLILKDVELERLNDTAARALIARRPVVIFADRRRKVARRTPARSRVPTPFTYRKAKWTGALTRAPDQPGVV